ncbi:MAG TPA: RNA-binding cell elongation regulator Jag/EloR [Acidimicrobiia bacterium]|jgi:spoIIIJ-associated protein|nr:RNA-binding cell elongation regulator Jag/EloR [Acidimicrobiia bacterium]
MEWIEVTGRTVDEAKERALDELGVHESELEFEVLDEARSGFLGRIGRSDARIRARIKPLSREKPADRRRRRRSEGGRGDGEGSSGSRGRKRPAREGGGGGAAKSKPKPRSKPKPEPTPAAEVATGAAESSAPAGAAPGPKRRNRSRSRNRPNRAEVTESDEEEQPDMDSEVNLDEQEAVAVEFVEGLLDALGVGGSVRTTRTEDDGVELDIEGDGLGLLVGPKGATLAALEELTRAAVQHAGDGARARLHVDVGGYRQRRREALAEFTRQVASEVQSGGDARALEPMSAADRKVVHDTVAELDGLSTVSEGEDARRHVVIRPA